MGEHWLCSIEWLGFIDVDMHTRARVLIMNSPKVNSRVLSLFSSVNVALSMPILKHSANAPETTRRVRGGMRKGREVTGGKYRGQTSTQAGLVETFYKIQ